MQDSLKKECIRCFATRISVATVINIYQFATHYNLEELIEGCSLFVAENLSNVVQSPVFSNLEKDDILPLLKTSPELGTFKS